MSPAFNFQARFADAVESGEKRQTIRAERKHPIMVGDTLHLFTGMRTKRCRKLGQAVCKSVERVEIDEFGCAWLGASGYDCPEDIGAFARADGFCSYEAMRVWFEKTHGLPFVGRLYRWDALRALADPGVLT